MCIVSTTKASALALANSTDNQTIGNGGNHVGKEKKDQKDGGLGIQVHHQKGPF